MKFNSQASAFYTHRSHIKATEYLQSPGHSRGTNTKSSSDLFKEGLQKYLQNVCVLQKSTPQNYKLLIPSKIYFIW